MQDRQERRAERSVLRRVTDNQSKRIANQPGPGGDDRFEALFENIPVMYFVLGAGGVVLSANSHGAHELGYEPDELVGESVLKVIHPDDHAAVTQQLGATLEEPGRVARWEFRKVRKDGSVLWVEESVRTVTTTDGRREVLVACQDVTERRLYDEQLRGHEQRLRSLTSALSLAEERERRRLAVDLHDRIGGTLALARARVGGLLQLQPPAGITQSLEEVSDLVDAAIQATRTLTSELSSPLLYELGLEAAVEDLGERISTQNGLGFSFESDRRPKPLTHDARIGLFRVVRELLVNVVKHAQAQNVTMVVETVSNRIRIRLTDDGVGFDVSRVGPTDAFGLFSVREQVLKLGGRIDIDSGPGKGARILVEAPCDGSRNEGRE